MVFPCSSNRTIRSQSCGAFQRTHTPKPFSLKLFSCSPFLFEFCPTISHRPAYTRASALYVRRILTKRTLVIARAFCSGHATLGRRCVRACARSVRAEVDRGRSRAEHSVAQSQNQEEERLVFFLIRSSVRSFISVRLTEKSVSHSRRIERPPDIRINGEAEEHK